MILGLFLNAIGIQIVPAVLITIGVLVQLAGFVFLIYRMKATGSMDTVNTAQIEKISNIAGLVFVIYVIIELIGVCACVTANEICRGFYHYPSGTVCSLCAGGHYVASDILMLGIYFDVFIVNSYVTAAVSAVKGFLARKKIHLF